MRRIDHSSEHGEAGLPVGALSDEILYPERDGQPMADNTEQFEWIVSIKQNLEAIFASRDDVFIAGDLLWYPVEGDPKTRVAPDALVAFGRPKGYRGSYLQWKEEAVAPQVVFEVLSPGNSVMEMVRKQQFYDRHGVEEYYLIDPSEQDVTGWRREEGHLLAIDEMNGYVSPRLGIRFQVEADAIVLLRPDGRPFESFLELERRAEHSERRAEEEARGRAEERTAREGAEEQTRRLAEKLRELGLDPGEL
jgi:Uma2 family endonuclease